LDRKWPKIAQKVAIVPVAVHTWRAYQEFPRGGEIAELDYYLASDKAKSIRAGA